MSQATNDTVEDQYDAGDMEVIPHAIQGLGGKVLKNQREPGTGEADSAHIR
jgi:hypothetical protein